jgi:hypothetical protein
MTETLGRRHARVVAVGGERGSPIHGSGRGVGYSERWKIGGRPLHREVVVCRHVKEDIE